MLYRNPPPDDQCDFDIHGDARTSVFPNNQSRNPIEVFPVPRNDRLAMMAGDGPNQCVHLANRFPSEDEFCEIWASVLELMPRSRRKKPQLRWAASHSVAALVLDTLRVGPVLMLLPSCAHGTVKDLQSVSSFRFQWRCELPQSLNGPLDTRLSLDWPVVRLARSARPT